MGKSICWLVGRGASIACNLTWVVPDPWKKLDRRERIAIIKKALRDEMEKPSINCLPYANLLVKLSRNTAASWKHLFITTNWDYLLQRELQRLNLSVLPRWLSNSHVFHINGSVEVLQDNSKRSPFLLEEDSVEKYEASEEADIAFQHMIWGEYFVIIGMSFECEMDRFLLASLNRVQNDLPIGESSWFIINPDKYSLNQSSERIQRALPNATIVKIPHKFELWVEDDMPELQEIGVLT